MPLDAVSDCGTPFTHVEVVPLERATGAAVTPGVGGTKTEVTGAGVITGVTPPLDT